MPGGHNEGGIFSPIKDLSSASGALRKIISITLVRSYFRSNRIGSFMRSCKVIVISRYRRMSSVAFRGILGRIATRCICKLATAPVHGSKLRPVVFVRYNPVQFSISTGTRVRGRSFRHCLIPEFASCQPIASSGRAFATLSRSLTRSRVQGGLVVRSILGTMTSNHAPVVLADEASRIRLVAGVLRPRMTGIVGLAKRNADGRGHRVVRGLRSVPQSTPLMVITAKGCMKRNFSCPELSALFLTLPVS